MIDGIDCGSIRVLLAGDDTGALSHLRAMQPSASGIVVIAEASTLEHTATLAVRLKPHVIVAASATFGRNQTAAIRVLARVAHDARILVICEHPEDDEWLLLALDAGAAGVVSSDATHDELLSAIRAAASDQIVLRRSAFTALTAHARPSPLAGPPSAGSLLAFGRLTDRERSVFRLIAEGYSAPEIGDQLRISKKTVETYKKRIGVKLGFSHRADYVRFALRVGVLGSPPPERPLEAEEVLAESAAR
jgi:DNA-binding NarL/FixJ family response regulator